MTGLARTVLIMAVACALCLSYCLFNTQHLARSISYDEVFYFSWVDNWADNQVYYPHHLLFGPASVLFQRCFTALTGIENTAFIQRFKNILAVSVGLSAFFILFYLHSKRLLVSLTFAILIGLSGSLLNDARRHETSIIPGILIVLVMFSLVFYRTSRRPALFIAVFSIFNSLAILLHQVYLFTIPLAALVFLFSSPRLSSARRMLRRLGRAGLYLLLVASMVGGAYFYIGFVKLSLRWVDNPQGKQTYLAVPIHGNFVRYFYLIQAYGMWGKYKPDMVRQGIQGYLSSFVTVCRLDRIDPDKPFEEKHFTSNATAAMIGAILFMILIFSGLLLRRYGILFPVLLAWFVIGSLFIFWWEPWYIEHWSYITILTWVMTLMAISTVLERLRYFLPRTVAYAAVCAVLWSFAALAYQKNYTYIVLPQEKLSLPSNSTSNAWREEYRMDELYAAPQPGR